MSSFSSVGVEVFSTCPQSKGVEGAAYLEQVADVARWSEEAGCRGILVYSDNSLVDPWLVAQLVIQATNTLWPLVAVQPVYLHPYSAAKMVATLGHLHRRRVALNMLAGGFKNDLVALDDTTPHDERYERTVEYSLIPAQAAASGDDDLGFLPCGVVGCPGHRGDGSAVSRASRSSG
jgi:alkanesulfonate monooxygenase